MGRITEICPLKEVQLYVPPIERNPRVKKLAPTHCEISNYCLNDFKELFPFGH